MKWQSQNWCLQWDDLVHPPDGGLDILRDFFARSDTTLTKVTLIEGRMFGPAEETSQILAAFHTNRTVTDLTLKGIDNLWGAALGNSFSGILQNMPQLQRLDCFADLQVEGVRAMLPALRTNRTLKQLRLYGCGLQDEGIRLIADALVGNSIIQALDVSENGITANGLDDITRMIESMPRLHTIYLYDIRDVFDDEDATQRFVTTLQHIKSSVQELRGLIDQDESSCRRSSSSSAASWYTSIKNSLTRNEQLNRLDALLSAPSQPPRQQQQQQQPAQQPQQQHHHHHHHRHAGTMMLKISHQAIIKFAAVGNNNNNNNAGGASAIFKLFTARPQLLEKRLKRPGGDCVSCSAAGLY
jgi:Leucine Rich repeat